MCMRTVVEENIPRLWVSNTVILPTNRHANNQELRPSRRPKHACILTSRFDHGMRACEHQSATCATVNSDYAALCSQRCRISRTVGSIDQIDERNRTRIDSGSSRKQSPRLFRVLRIGTHVKLLEAHDAELLECCAFLKVVGGLHKEDLPHRSSFRRTSQGPRLSRK